MRCAAPMGANSDSKEENEVSGLISPALAVGGGAEARKESVSLMEADQMECVKISVKSNPGKHGEQVRIEDDVSDALRCGDEQRSRESSSANQTSSVSQRMVEACVGPGTCGVDYLSPQRIEGAESLSGEKIFGPDLKAYGAAQTMRPELEGKNTSLSGERIFGPDLKAYGAAQTMRPEVEGKNTCYGEGADPLCQERGLAQGIRRKFKRMARDKGKAQELVNAEKAQEVSNKRKALNDVVFSSEEFAQKCLCFGE